MFYQSFTVGHHAGDHLSNDIMNPTQHDNCASSDCAMSEITENFFS